MTRYQVQQEPKFSPNFFQRPWPTFTTYLGLKEQLFEVCANPYPPDFFQATKQPLYYNSRDYQPTHSPPVLTTGWRQRVAPRHSLVHPTGSLKNSKWPTSFAHFSDDQPFCADESNPQTVYQPGCAYTCWALCWRPSPPSHIRTRSQPPSPSLSIASSRSKRTTPIEIYMSSTE